MLAEIDFSEELYKRPKIREITKKYKVNIDLIYKREKMKEVEILERRYGMERKQEIVKVKHRKRLSS